MNLVKYKIAKINSLFSRFSTPTIPALADAEIICRIKGLGQRVFVLDSGIFSSNVFYKTPSGDLKIGVQKRTVNRLLSDEELQYAIFWDTFEGQTAWGETVIDFDKPSWKKRYRFAKLGQIWKEFNLRQRERNLRPSPTIQNDSFLICNAQPQKRD